MKGQHDSLRYPDRKQFKLDEGHGRIFLPKLGWMRLRLSRTVLGKLCNASVSQSGGKWYVSIQTEREVEQPRAAGNIRHRHGRFAMFSAGSFLEPLASFKRHETRLRRAQRAMSRKTKFSSNWKEAKAHV